MKKSQIKHLCLLGLMIALAFAFSYLESLMPLNIGIPGVKLGLANLVVLTALYTMTPRDAFLISVIRIVISGLTFNSLFTMLYSLSGGLISFLLMFLSKKSDKFSVIGVSVIGGISHNFGQIIVAAIVMNTYKLVYYFPVLMVSGLITGLTIGLLSKIIIDRLNKI